MNIKDTSDFVKSKLDLGDFNLNLPIAFLPQPNQNDYRLGFIDRYVVGRINSNEIIEVSKDNYNFVSTVLYKKIKFRWKITGTLNNKYQGNMLTQQGVVDFNRKQVNDVNGEIPGIKDIFTNYTQFYKPS